MFLLLLLLLLLLFFLYLPSNDSNLITSLTSSSYRMGESFILESLFNSFHSRVFHLFFHSHRHTFTNKAISFPLSSFIFLFSFIFVFGSGRRHARSVTFALQIVKLLVTSA